MIPKIIHYCWFGKGKMPKLAEKCIKSWNKFCKDYKIICWNEENFDIDQNEYVRQAYENRKYAFVTDYVRLFALYNYGGIYMDTDVEVIKSLDEFLKNKAFSGFESYSTVPTGIMASEAKLPVFKELLDYYDNVNFIDKDGKMNLTTNVEIITDIMCKKGLNPNNTLQVIDDFAFYPKEFFCPIDFSTKVKNITKNTVTIHWFSGSWVPKKDKIKIKVYNNVEKLFGKKIAKKFSNAFKRKSDYGK